MALDADLIDDFKSKTRYNLKLYFEAFEYFVQSHVTLIQSYYSGRSTVVPSDSITLMNSLVKESNRLDHIVNVNRSRFETTDYWDLLEMIDDIKAKLLTISNSDKWARTSKANATVVSDPSIDIRLRQNQTIERLAGDSLGYEDEENDWYDIAIKNDLAEEDYTPDGGANLNVNATGGSSITINSIVDVIDAETLKGKDIQKKFEWDEDESDIKVLSGDDAFLQSMNILATLRKEDNPEFVSHGLSPDVAVGQNINSVAYPILVREINETFGRDDSIDTFNITNLSTNEDGLFIEMEIFSKSRELYTISTNI